MIISGFAGIGKTYLSNKYKNVIDLESSDYKWIYLETSQYLEKEQQKGRLDRLYNYDWPDNYIEDILEANKKYDIVLISQSIEVLEELRFENIPFVIVIPELSLKNEYLERCKKRGNNEIFLKFIDDNYEYFISSLMEENDEKIILKSGEFLEDVLIKKGILKACTKL